MTTESTVANSIALPMSNLRALIETKVLAAVTFCTTDGVVQSIFHPCFLPTQDGSQSSVIYGNAFNEHGLLGPIKIDVTQGRFCGVLSEADMDEFELPKPTPLPADLVTASNLGEGNFYLVSTPKIIAGHFQQRYPAGKLANIQHTLEANGVGVAVWIALFNSVDSQSKIDQLRTIFEHDVIQASLDDFVAYGSADVDIGGPGLGFMHESLEFYPDHLNNLKSVFVNSETSSVSHPAAPIQHELTTNEDRHQAKKAEKNLIRLGLPMVRASIVDNKIDLSSVARPETTIAFDEIKSTPPGGQKDALAEMIRCFISEKEDTIDPTDETERLTLTIFPSPIVDHIVKGNWTTSPIANCSVDAQLSQMSIFNFLPRDPDNMLVQAYLDEETSARAQNKSGGSTSKQLRTLLASIGPMDDDMAANSLINARHILGILFDFKQMAATGQRSIFDAIAMKLIGWFMLQSKNKFGKWRANSGNKMPFLGAILVQWTELFFAACGVFSRSLHNQSIMADPTADLSTLDVSAINQFLRDFDTFTDCFGNKQRTMTAWTDVPALFYAVQKLSMTGDDSSHQPPSEREDRGSRDSSERNDRGSRESRASRQQQPARGNDGAGNGQGPSKRQKPSANGGSGQQPVGPAFNGILCLREGVALEEGFPQNFPACKKHVTRGYQCTFGDNCSAHHWAKLSEASSRHIKTWLEHLRATKVGFINQWKLGGRMTTADPELRGIVGPPGFPPPRFVSRKEEVQQRQISSITSNEGDGTSHNSKRFFSAPPVHLSKSVSQSSHLPPIPPPSQAAVSESKATSSHRHSDKEGPLVITDRLIRNAKHGNKVLDAYSTKYGGTKEAPIVTTQKGKKRKRIMPPRLTASYRVSDLTFDLVTLPLFASGYLDLNAYGAMEQVNKRFHRLVPKHLRWCSIDTSPIQLPRMNYAAQESIDYHRVEMASAQFIRFGGDPDKLVRFCSQEYILEHLDREAILQRIRESIPSEDYHHIQRVLYEGCPAELSYEEENRSRLRSFERGNQISYLRNTAKVTKAMNKEDKNSHVIPIDEDLAFFSPFCRHTPQGAIDKPGKSFRIVWDGSTKERYDDVVLNDVTPTNKEAPITFGVTEGLFDKDIYDYRVSFPNETIYLGFGDVTSCFKFPRVNPGLSGAFGFLDSHGLYHLATSMVFGSTVSANQWEPFRRTIETLSMAFQDRNGLVEKHKQYLDMIQWEENAPAPSVIAKRCALCPGVLDENGNPIARPARMYVDDALLAAAKRTWMEKKLAATVEAIFCVMGPPDETRRRCPLSLEKWGEMTISPFQTLLGLHYDTVKLTKGTTPEYRAELLRYLHEHWPLTRTTFTAHDMQILVGKLARLAKGARWVFHILSHAYDQIAIALASNYRMLHRHSSQFKALISCIKKGQMGKSKLSQESGRLVAFALKQASQLVHRSRSTYTISEFLREDIEFFRSALHADSDVQWSSPLAHIVPRTAIGIPFGDACLTGCGGYCTELKFWWHLSLPQEIVRRTLIYIPDDSAGNLISINALEFVTIILNYCASLSVISESKLFTDDPFPVILCLTDNTSALNWVNHRCKGSALGRALGRLFVGLIMDSCLGINAAWLSTYDNEVADAIQGDPSGVSALVAELTADLAHLHHINNKAKSVSKGAQELQTTRSRQAHYLAWCDYFKVRDPVGDDPSYKTLVGMYLQNVRLGNNYNNKQTVRSATLRGYAESVNQLFSLRRKPLPYDPEDKCNDSNVAISNLADEEDIALQREPLTASIAAEAIRIGQHADQDSGDSLISNIICLSRLVGPRLSEYGNKQQKKITYHTWGSGRRIVRAWIAQDFTFFDKNGVELSLVGRSSDELLSLYPAMHYMKVTWRIQKNRRNGQSLKIPVERAHQAVCPVYNALQIVMRKVRLDPSNLDTPVCVYVTNNSTVPLFITGSKVKNLIHRAIEIVNPTMPKEERQKYSAHSLRVWACVLLDQAKKPPSFIKQRLRWLGESYRLYLRDTLHQSQSHRDALSDNTEAIMSALSATADEFTSAIGTPEGGTQDDDESSELHDEED